MLERQKQLVKLQGFEIMIIWDFVALVIILADLNMATKVTGTTQARGYRPRD